MRLRTFVVRILPVLVATSAFSQTAVPEPRGAAVASGLPELILTGPPRMDFIGARPGSLSLGDRMAHYGVPGVSLAVIAADRVAWARGYGVLDVETGAPVTSDALFEAASTTKFVTATAVWRLIRNGELAFDDEANDHLTSWKIPDNEFTATGKVTLRRLLSHTAGVNRPSGGFSSEGGVPSLLQVLRGAPPATNEPLAVTAAPGGGHAYSNFGYLVFQPLLADLLGEPYAEVMKELVLAPLGMTSSGFDPDRIGDGASPRSRHHGPAGEPLDGGGKVAILSHGGLWTTSSDLARLMLAVMQGSRGAGPMAGCAAVLREATSPEYAFAPDEFFGFSGQGLGMFLLKTDHGTGIAHPGQNDPGATCFLIGFPETGQGAVVMANGAQGVLLTLELLSSLATVEGWPRIICE